MRPVLVAIFLSLICFNFVAAAVPPGLDDFLGVLFETSECEEFVSDASFLSVSTFECEPYECDFPYELCSRPAAQYQDKSANQCRSLPVECVKAANGGVLPEHRKLPKPAVTNTVAPPIQPEPGFPEPDGGKVDLLPRPPPRLITAPPPPPAPTSPRDICKMGVPGGRFCGFQLKFVFNRETGQCDEFWFPGCRTAETNANLFDSLEECAKIALLCRETTQPKRPRRPRPRPRPDFPDEVDPVDPQPARPLRPGGGQGFGPQGGGGFMGQGFGSQGGENVGANNIFGLITQGINAATGGRLQPSRQGGAGGGAGNGWLQQFSNFNLNNIPEIIQRTIGAGR